MPLHCTVCRFHPWLLGVPGALYGTGLQSWYSGPGPPLANTGDFSLKPSGLSVSHYSFSVSAFKYIRKTNLQSVIHILVLNIRNLKMIWYSIYCDVVESFPWSNKGRTCICSTNNNEGLPWVGLCWGQEKSGESEMVFDSKQIMAYGSPACKQVITKQDRKYSGRPEHMELGELAVGTRFRS